MYQKIICFLGLFLIVTSVAHADVKCQSVTTGLVKVFDQAVRDYIDLRTEAAGMLANALAPDALLTPEQIEELAEKAEDLQLAAYKSYGVIVGEGTGKIGARTAIVPTKKVTGNLLVERTFVVSNSPYDRLKVTIRKTGGKGGADIAVCSKYTNGSHHNEKRKSIAKSKNTTGDEVSFAMWDMDSEKTLSIHLVKTGFPTDRMQYEMSISGEFVEDELRKLQPVKGKGKLDPHKGTVRKTLDDVRKPVVPAK